MIMELNPLIPVGTKIKIDKSNIENLLTTKLLEDLPKEISGKIIDYKMTDGMGIGYVLMTDNNIKIWIFNDELNAQTKQEYKLETADQDWNTKDLDVFFGKFNIFYKINGNRNIKVLANPINIISWLAYVLKDIF